MTLFQSDSALISLNVSSPIMGSGLIALNQRREQSMQWNTLLLTSYDRGQGHLLCWEGSFYFFLRMQKNIRLIDYFRKDHTIYRESLSQLDESVTKGYQDQNLRKTDEGVFFHQDNVHGDKSLVSMVAVHGYGIELVDSHPYSDLTS